MELILIKNLRELMKLLNGKQGKNNEGTENYAGLAVIPASIENI